MKQVLIIVGVLIAIFFADIALRLFSDQDEAPREPTPSETVPPPGDVAAPDSERPAAPAVEPWEVPRKKDIPAATERRPEVEDMCADFGRTVMALAEAAVRGAKPDNHTPGSKTFNLTPEIAGRAADYFSCKAVETDNPAYCSLQPKWFPTLRDEPSCDLAFKFLVPQKALYMQRLSREDFAARVSTLPENLRDWLVEFYAAVAEQRPSACGRLTDTKLADRACRLATGEAAAAAEGSELGKIARLFDAIKTGRGQDLEKSNEKAEMLELWRAMAGEKGQCESRFSRVLTGTCANAALQSPTAFTILWRP
ncbi:MAG: hypothetical protein C4523_01675 [Myxococcales bacterium]|nr:MAG: hypothetical protein C4523_01675 [Myxococcales bacterium]